MKNAPKLNAHQTVMYCNFPDSVGAGGRVDPVRGSGGHSSYKSIKRIWGGVGLIPRSVLPPAHSWDKCTGDYDLGLIPVVTTMVAAAGSV